MDDDLDRDMTEPDRDLEGLDRDLAEMDRAALIAEVKRLRTGIRAHRDSTGHDLSWHHPDLWGLLPERVEPEVAVPPWPKFLRGCIAYRASLDQQLPGAPVADVEYGEGDEASPPCVRREQRRQ